VVAADGVLCDLTRRLAADDLRVACLLSPSDDPHQFQLEPRQKAQLAASRLVLINGYGLTPSLQDLPGAVPVAERAVPDSLMLTEDGGESGPDGAQEDHAKGHAHGGHEHGHHDHGDRDPHVWHDPRHAQAMTSLIAERLEAIRPEARERIRRRAAGLENLLSDLDRWNRTQLATIPAPRPPLATSHRAFASFSKAYGLGELALVDGFSSSDSLRPEEFRRVIQALDAQQVPRLFAEQLPAPKALLRISELSRVPIAPAPLSADGLAADASGRPMSLMATLTGNTCTITTGLGGRCDLAAAQALNERWEAVD
jgi:ABC-type Zn uptake system ZnuABC Zn-binding protein ZnuA